MVFLGFFLPFYDTTQFYTPTDRNVLERSQVQYLWRPPGDWDPAPSKVYKVHTYISRIPEYI
jgi:hypothetical protein